MSTARLVPVTIEMDGDDLDAEDAWRMVRRIGARRLAWDAFRRFRYGDGFSHSRALALQAALAVVPFILALSGLALDLDEPGPAEVLARTIDAISPGGSRDAMTSAIRGGGTSEQAGEVALAVGLFFSLVSMTAATAQVERGSNRIYGIRRDRPAPWKYGRAAVITLVLAVPVGVGFLLLVAGGAFGDAMVSVYGWSSTTDRWWDVLRWPVGVALLVLTIAVLLDHSPRRHQPTLSWLALGAGIGVLMTLAATGLLAVYVRASGSFDEMYGPLAGIFALLLWTFLTSVALFYGTAVAAQLEACRAGETVPVLDDPGRPRSTAVEG